MTERQRIILSLASNHHQESLLAEARACLGGLLADLAYTDELWTEPIGSRPDSNRPKTLYLNQLATATTLLPADELELRFKQIEQQLGRTPELRRKGVVPIDIDLLCYGSQRFHAADWERPYVRDLMPQCLKLIPKI